MARKLNTVSLPKNTRWRNASSWSGVAQEVQKTLGNVVVVFARPDSGIPIDLEIAEYAHITQTERQWLVELSQQVGATFTFEWDSITTTVFFRHHDFPALEITPIIPTRDESDEKQLFTAFIKLMSI